MWDLGDNVNVTFRALMELWGRGGPRAGAGPRGGGVVDETAKVGGDELIIGLFLRLAKRL